MIEERGKAEGEDTFMGPFVVYEHPNVRALPGTIVREQTIEERGKAEGEDTFMGPFVV